MIHRFGLKSGMEVPLAVLALASCLTAQSFVSELKAVRNPGKRSEKALTFADTAFDNARHFYKKGQIEKGDAALDQMTDALTACLQSAEIAHKAKYFKKAELNVATLQRRLTWLVSDLDVRDRGWAEITSKKVDKIHNKLLAGVMRK
ncbi:MAG: hypothetical protein ACRD4O_10040 [Bryobacteraceae bacterium]